MSYQICVHTSYRCQMPTRNVQANYSFVIYLDSGSYTSMTSYGEHYSLALWVWNVTTGRNTHCEFLSSTWIL